MNALRLPFFLCFPVNALMPRSWMFSSRLKLLRSHHSLAASLCRSSDLPFDCLCDENRTYEMTLGCMKIAKTYFRRYGILMQTSVYPREVVKRGLDLGAAAVILAHNHPSGVAEPSRSDELLTQALDKALALVDIRVLDHLVVGAGEVVSLAERGP